MALTPETEINWQDYVAIIIRRRWLLILPTVVIVVASMAVGFSMPRLYRAETVLLVQDSKVMNPLIQGMAVSSPVAVRMRIVQQELLGWTSLSRLVHELGLDKNVQTPGALESLVRELKKGIGVSGGKGNLLALSYTNEDPALAQTVLNTVTDIYIQRNVESQTAEAETAIRFIESEMAGYQKQMEGSDQALREFKELYTMQMPVAAQLNQQIISLQVQLAQLLVENTEEHPTVVQVKRQIADLKQRRNDEIKRVILEAIGRVKSPAVSEDVAKQLDSQGQPADPQVQAARDAYQAWVSRLDAPTTLPADGQPSAGVPADAPTANAAANESQSPLDVDVSAGGVMSISLAPRQEQQYSKLKRDYEIHQQTYREMQRRLERAKITQRLGESDEGTKFKIIEPARLPLHPVSPKLWLIFSGSFAIGLFVGVCAAFAAEYLDQSFQSSEEAQTALALPVLGSISTIVTAGDVQARKRRVTSWVSYKGQSQRIKAGLQSLWGLLNRPLGNGKSSKGVSQEVKALGPTSFLARIDKALLRWGL